MNTKYEIIQPPFTLKFAEMSKKELADYFQWFMRVIPDRINELANAIRQTSGFEAWQPDKTPSSLNALGDWLSTHVETRERTQNELREIKSRSSYRFDVSGKELTNETVSLAMDTGIYVSQVFLHNCPSLRWNQPLGSKKFFDYGQPVLSEFIPAPFNPVRMMVTLAYGLADKTWNGRRLRELYDYWAEQVRSKP